MVRGFFYAANLDTKDAMEFLYKELNANIFIQEHGRGHSGGLGRF